MVRLSAITLLHCLLALAGPGCGSGNGGMAGAAGEGGVGGDGGVGGAGGDGAEPGVILYDRSDFGSLAPFPDDYFLQPDPTTKTGLRVELMTPPGEFDVQLLYSALIAGTTVLDGFSPVGGLVLQMSMAADLSSLPLTADASVDPDAAVRLFDVTAGSETFGAQVPFELTPVTRTLPGQDEDHSWVLYPSIPLSPAGRYALVVTRDVRTVDGGTFVPSPFMAAVLGPPSAEEDAAVTRVRDLLDDEVLAVIANDAVVSGYVAPEDIALVVRFSVRSIDDIPLTPLSMKEQILGGPAPSYSIDTVVPDLGEVAAVARGTWQAPNWREEQYFISRDGAGLPQITGTLSVPFVLALPKDAEAGPVPVVMFQHGSPGSAEQVVQEARATLASEGFAVVGFTDTLNRERGQDLTAQNTFLFQTLVAASKFPDFAMQTYADQIAFLRVIEQLGTLDLLPLPDGDGVPDLDLGAPLTYVGLSQGSVHGSAFLTYAPEVKAAAITAGAQRQGEAFFNGGTFIDLFPPDLLALLANVTPTDFWVALSIFQMIFDHQDPHHHAAFLYRNRFEVAGTTRKPSILLQAGVADPIVPANAIHSLAWTFGPLPHLEPVQLATPILDPVDGPLTANIDSETTAAFYQFVPMGVPGLEPTPGCTSESNGHFCAQIAAEAQEQRARFLRSAVEDAVPTIVDPLQ